METEVGFLDDFQYYHHMNLGNTPLYHAYLAGDTAPTVCVSQLGETSLLSPTQSSPNFLDWTTGSSSQSTSIGDTNTASPRSASFSVTSDSCKLAGQVRMFHNSSPKSYPLLGRAYSNFLSFSPQFSQPSFTSHNGLRVDANAKSSNVFTFAGCNIPQTSEFISNIEAGQPLSDSLKGSGLDIRSKK